MSASGVEETQGEIVDYRVLATGLRFPEGPVAMHDGSVALVEIEGQRLVRVLPDGEVREVAQLGGGPNGLAIGPDGAFYVCNNGGFIWRSRMGFSLPVLPGPDYQGGSIQRVDPVGGAVTTLYDRCGTDRLSAPNDLVFDHHGGFYFTDTGKARARDRDHGGVYYALADGSHIVEVAHPVLTPNGIGLSADDRVLYVAEMETARIWAFDIEEPGRCRKQPFPSPHGGRLIAGLGGFQRFDSLAVDGAGNICVGTLAIGRLSVIAPDGRLVRQLPMPDLYPTNICFGGPGLRTAYITLSLTGRLIATDWPEGGQMLAYSA
jgi:gluconolactonase